MLHCSQDGAAAARGLLWAATLSSLCPPAAHTHTREWQGWQLPAPLMRCSLYLERSFFTEVHCGNRNMVEKFYRIKTQSLWSFNSFQRLLQHKRPSSKLHGGVLSTLLNQLSPTAPQSWVHLPPVSLLCASLSYLLLEAQSHVQVWGTIALQG